ncbi:MAG TPA: hypothetical protein PKD32_07515 [Saprospiraceae bacterium]|nr:hypothetical protein [Saprospiraceae bacterium]
MNKIIILILTSLLTLQAQSLEEPGNSSDHGFTCGSRIILRDNFERDSMYNLRHLCTPIVSLHNSLRKI